MKNIYKISLLLVAVVTFFNCQDEDQKFGNVVAPTNLILDFEIQGVDAANPNGDGTGIVSFIANADNAITYQFNFGDGTSVEATTSGEITHQFTQTGINTYNVTVSASGLGGLKTSTALNLDVKSDFNDQEAKDLLSGGESSSKVWYLAGSQPGHLGVGGTIDIAPDAFYFPGFYAATPFEKCSDGISDCLCNDELIFSQDSNNQLTYKLNNKGRTFINAAHQLSAVGMEEGQDACFEFDTSGISNVSLAPSTTDYSTVADPAFMPRGTVLNFSDDAFMGYYVSSSSYEILEITDDYLYVRTIDGLNPVLAWYHKFVSSGCYGDTGDDIPANNNVLVWEEEFNVDGAPCNYNWQLEEGTGDNGWGNNESQYYTNRPENVVVENGILKITARAESFMGSDYTSARMISQGRFEFQYGKVEVRAKLPEGAGTWPAIWMLGDMSEADQWPDIGEIDIMEHVGNNQNTIFSSLHYPGNFGGNANTGSTTVPTASSEFHVYSVEWDANTINFFVDGTQFHTFNNSSAVPFNHEFFLILNVAMGGNFGGPIDPDFTESTMEIDYIRVYQ
ncbi:family 16 glycosylhydrolase [Lacinutrix sp. MedPE-SW]|uniref:family 16 glycosylhydrolase n=1 Tax=Lacinutrix sp. MedPE-SW TaxID=1860087 RepID=UPI0025B82370|nr:family 16 glycosylhydrolase [Lacinutrix sp. MedPE-SW]